jgi:hypothetical protein
VARLTLSVTDAAPGRSLYRVYARGAAAAFLLVVLYTVLRKVPDGEFARDWTHTALHVVTAVFALHAGWLADDARPARALTAALALTYGALGVGGWFTDGLFMGSVFRIPLQSADNIFHLAFAIAATVTVVMTRFEVHRRGLATSTVGQ